MNQPPPIALPVFAAGTDAGNYVMLIGPAVDLGHRVATRQQVVDHRRRMHAAHAVTTLEAVMPLDAISNVLPFRSQHLSRRDRALIGEWRLGATPLGVTGVDVRDEMPDDHVHPIADRITIQFKRGVADGHFVVIQRAHGERDWVTLLLRVEPDGSMTLPIGSGETIRRDETLRQALNAVRPVLPDADCRLLDYHAARQVCPRPPRRPGDGARHLSWTLSKNRRGQRRGRT